MNEAECDHVALLVTSGKLTVRWAPEGSSGVIGYGAVAPGGAVAGDGRFLAHRVRHAPRGGTPRLLEVHVLDYQEVLANAQTSAGGGSGLGGYPFLLAVARAMLEVAPPADHAAWRAVVERFEAADRKIAASRTAQEMRS